VKTTPNRNRCVCNDNFRGDAYAVDGCNEINFCTKNNGGCDVNANCAPKFNGAGDVECRCKDGYGGSNPYIQGGCVPYTSCTASHCGDNAQCVNVSNAFAEPAASADFKAVDKQCVCKAGAGSLNGKNCKVCSAGEFKVGMGNAECQKCPPGTMSGEGAKECIRCAAGTFATGGSSMCEKCPPGTTSGRGAKECRAETERVCMLWKWTTLRASNDTLGFKSFKYEWYTCKDVLKSQPHTYERWAAGRKVDFWVGGNNCGANTTAAFCKTTGPSGEHIFQPKLPGGFTVAANVFCDKDWWAKMYFCDEFNNIAPAASNQTADASNVSAVGK
jgi:hypothetical protein